jgi:hypothetical protein
MSNIVIPPSQEVRDKLAAAQAKARYLRRLLKLARERDEAKRLSAKAKANGAKP